MADKVTWFELPADDTARAGKFYSSVFGWNASDMGGGSFMVTSSTTDDEGTPSEPGSISGDISPRSKAFNAPLIVITVDDIAAKIKQVEAEGGAVALPPQEVTALNMIWAIITDTEGNNVGILQEL